jgi:hypothetical protein
MKTQAIDTHPEAEGIQIELLRQAGVPRRAALMCSLSQAVIELSRRAVQRAHPTASLGQVLLIWVGLHYGQDLAQRVGAYIERSPHEFS